jgi:TolB-like protein/AraC-like DNA-binding protein/Tfp pilus assembly protein PilF
MAGFFQIKDAFLQQVIAEIEANMADEHFGVSDLADKVGMSRSNLLRKVQKLTGHSVSVLIRQVRLHHARELLQQGSLNVSEVSYKVGFNSTSYFIKCFREHYGYPPGEESERHRMEHAGADMDNQPEEAPLQPVADTTRRKQRWLWPALAVLLLAIAAVYILLPQKATVPKPFEKSIAVLPFKNDSNDSSNVYFVNGLMEAVLNNLQKIENLRVVSRTSVEQYRHQSKSIAQIAEELNVSYFVEGSGQKVGDQVILTIQLIEANSDSHLWSERYSRQTLDIFALQAEVAQDIANEIEVIITPAEQRRIEKIPTKSLTAYDYYLKGLELTRVESLEALEEAIVYFQKAMAEDPDFAIPYVSAAICYYYLDSFSAEKKHSDQLKNLADQAIALDPELPDAYLAKGFYYLQQKEYDLAEDYMEKVLLYNPNSATAYIYLAQIYDLYKPDTQKYLTFALKGIQLDHSGVDSTTTSYSYMQLANALVQNGFVTEAEQYIKRSIGFDGDNLFSEYIYAYILMAKDMNVERTKQMLLKTLARDTTRLDVVQEVAKMYYGTEDYPTAMAYYDKFTKARDMLSFDIFTSEDLKIGFVLRQMGREEEAVKYLQNFKAYAEADETIYHDLSLAAYYAAQGDLDKGMEHLKAFSTQSNYKYWYVLVLEDDPIMNRLAQHPDYQLTVDIITQKFWKEHEQLRARLEEEGLIQVGEPIRRF